MSAYPAGLLPPESLLDWGLLFAIVVLCLYAALIVGLLAAGRRTDARAWAGFIPDCVVLVKRLVSDDRVPRRRKVVLLALVAYLVMPIDLVPDFLPVIGVLDDAVIAAFAIRYALRSGGRALLAEHWPGPPGSLAVVERLAFGRRIPAA